MIRVSWEDVACGVLAYGEQVREPIAQFGEEHPFIRTEYKLEVLDGEGVLFLPHRLAQLQGDHLRQHRAEPAKRYAGLLDVASEEEEGSGPEAFDNASHVGTARRLRSWRSRHRAENSRSITSLIAWPRRE